jgi:hypothetical protein
MALLERYLHAVHGHLPAKERDDILAELEDDIRARFDERERAVGRPLTEDEEAALLAPYGRPMLLAARYKRRQYLIGPEVFPFYVTTLKVGLAVALVVHVAVVMGLAVSGRSLGEAVELLTNYPNAALKVFFWVTAGFALFDLAIARTKINDKWDPRTLPRVPTTALRPSRLEVGFELVIGALFVAWWTSLPRAPELIFGPAEAFLTLGPTWMQFYVPVLAVALASLLAKSITLVRPDWIRFRLVAGVVMAAAALALMGLLIRSGDLVVPLAGSAEAATLARVANLGLRVSFAIAGIIIGVSTLHDIRRFTRARTRPPVPV